MDGEAFERRVPGVLCREVQEAGDVAGVGEVQLDADAFVVLVPGDRLEHGGAEEECAVIEGMDEQFGKGVSLGIGAGEELIKIAGGLAAFFPDDCVAGPVPPLEADMAAAPRIDGVQLVELGEGLAGWFFDEDGFARLKETAQDVEVGFRSGADENAGDIRIVDNGLELMSKAAAREERGQLLLPVARLCADISELNVEIPEEGIEVRQAVDADADERIRLARLEEGGLKKDFPAVMVISL
jgi:hypothetical protein